MEISMKISFIADHKPLPGCVAARPSRRCPTVRWHGDDLSQPCRTRDTLTSGKTGWRASCNRQRCAGRRGYAMEGAVSASPLLTPGTEPRDLRVEIASSVARVAHRNNDDIPTVSWTDRLHDAPQGFGSA